MQKFTTHSKGIIEEIINTPHSGDEKANQLINKYLSKHQRTQSFESLTTPPWDAKFFGLHQSSLFNQIKEEQQQAILFKISQFLLLESYGIEKIGINYCGKLANIAPTMQERQMFAFIGADEATHLQWLLPYIPEEMRTNYISPFLGYMDEVIVYNTANVLYYLVQILLEGWSIQHYKALYQGCQDEPLKQIIKDTLKDESNHHHTGKTFFSAAQFSDQDKAFVMERLKGYCDVLRIGPFQVVKAFDEVLGGLSVKDKTTLLDELKTLELSKLKMQMFKRLLVQPGLETMIQDLEDQGFLTPISLEECAKRCCL